MVRLPRIFLFLLSLSALASCTGHENEFARSLAVTVPAEWVLMNGRILTGDKFSPREAVGISGGRVIAVGSDGELRRWTGPHTRVVNLGGRTVIPGLIDSHIHATVAGSTWNSDVHWEFTRSLAEGLRQIAAKAASTPPGTWIVVGGGWVPTQFSDRRFPTRADLDAVAPKHPVYVQYLREGALLNSAALKALGINARTPDPAGGQFERDPKTGEPNGLLRGAAAGKYADSRIARLTLDQLRAGLRSCFRELNRRGITSIVDFQTEDVTFAHRRLLSNMARAGELSVRINYYVAPSEPGDELEQLRRVTAEIKQLASNDMFRFGGFDGIFVHDASERDDMLPKPGQSTLDPKAKEQFRQVLRFLAREGYNFSLEATHDQTAAQLLDVVEEVDREIPFARQRIAFAHMEDVAPATIARIVKLGGGITVQDRMLLTGERNVEVWGPAVARQAPPLRAMIDAKIPLAAGTDAFRSGNYSPMHALWWLITGKSIAGTPIRDPRHNLSREEALRLYTTGAAWFTFEEDRKGSIEPGKFADLAVLNADYLSVPEEKIPGIESVLTMVGGRVVYAAGPFAQLEKK